MTLQRYVQFLVSWGWVCWLGGGGYCLCKFKSRAAVMVSAILAARHRIFVLVVTSPFVFFPMHNKFFLLLLILQLDTCYKKTYFVEQFCFIFITRYFSTIITFHIWESCLTLRLTVRVPVECFRISLGLLAHFAISFSQSLSELCVSQILAALHAETYSKLETKASSHEGQCIPEGSSVSLPRMVLITIYVNKNHAYTQSPKGVNKGVNLQFTPIVSLFRCKIGVVLKLYTFFYKRRSKSCILGVNASDMLGLEAWSRPRSQFSATLASASS